MVLGHWPVLGTLDKSLHCSLSLNVLIFNWHNKTYLMGLNEIMLVKCLVLVSGLK